MSNHGGNNLDGTPAAIRMVNPIADAVGDQIEVLMDGGIRRGSDVVKALALGARAVMIGRAYLWGLAANGQAGVENVLDVLRGGIDSALLGLGRLLDRRARRPSTLLVPDGLPPGARRPVAGPTLTPTSPRDQPGRAGAVVLVPVGSIEQHGPHLPLDTDTVIAEAVAAGVAAELPGAWVAPADRLRRQRRAPVLRRHRVDRHRGAHATWSSSWSARCAPGRTGSCFVNGHGGNLVRCAAVDSSSRGHDVDLGALRDRGRRPARRLHRDLADAAPAPRVGAARPRRGRATPSR